MPDFPPIPPEVKHIAHFLKVAEEHEERNLVISYWSRMYAVTVAMESVVGKKSPELSALLVSIMDWLEGIKKANMHVEGIASEACAQALIEQYVLQLFAHADGLDQSENFTKNTVKAFYTSGILMDVLQQFGQLSEDLFAKRKYAKWKAAYIHNCLKNGDQPLPGPPKDRKLILGESDDEDDEGTSIINPVPQVSPPENSPFSDITTPILLPPVAPEPTQPSPSFASINFPPMPPSPVVTPVPSFPSVAPEPGPSGQQVQLNPEQLQQAQKYCKWAGSALNYEDTATAINNLQEALHLLQFGKQK